MKAACFIVAILSLTALWGCDKTIPRPASLRNATGRQIYVLHVSDHEDRNQIPINAKWAWPWRWRVPIADGDAADLMQDVYQPWIVEIDDGPCRLWYRIPQFDYDREILTVDAVKLGPDFLMYADLSTYRLLRNTPNWQPSGFPVAPSERKCEAG